jgi:hypothetical protein
LLASPRPLALPPLVPPPRLVVAADCERLTCKPAPRLGCQCGRRGAGLFSSARDAPATLNRAAIHTIFEEPADALQRARRQRAQPELSAGA